jgi:drug/metabolite transporter (DMT)-like permease
VFALASYGMYSLHYATMKWLGANYPLWQLVLSRSVLMLAITLLVSERGTLRAAVASPYKGSTAFRGVLQFLSMACFYKAANVMSLSEVTILYSAAPIITVVLSIFLLGESVEGYRWLAVIVGVAGTAIAANPGGEMSAAPSLYALGSGLFWALTIVFTRKSGARESTSVQLLITGLVFTVLSAALLKWKAPATPGEWGLMIALGGQIYLAQYFFFQACRFAPASLVGPLEYSGVVWAAILGFLIFSDIPTPHVILGALLVCGGGIVLAVSARRETRRSACG